MVITIRSGFPIQGSVDHELPGTAVAYPVRRLMADGHILQLCILVIIRLVVIGIGTGYPEVKSMRHRYAWGCQASGKSRAVICPAQDIYIIRKMIPFGFFLGVQFYVVKICLKIQIAFCLFRFLVKDNQHLLYGLAVCHLADIGINLVPLVGVQHLAGALRACLKCIFILVKRHQVA